MAKKERPDKVDYGHPATNALRDGLRYSSPETVAKVFVDNSDHDFRLIVIKLLIDKVINTFNLMNIFTVLISKILIRESNKGPIERVSVLIHSFIKILIVFSPEITQTVISSAILANIKTSDLVTEIMSRAEDD